MMQWVTVFCLVLWGQLLFAGAAKAQVWLPSSGIDLAIPVTDGYTRFAEPEPMGITAYGKRLYIALTGENAVLVLRLEDQKVIARWPVSDQPTDVLATKGSIFVVAEGRSELLALSRRTGLLRAQYPLEGPAGWFKTGAMNAKTPLVLASVGGMYLIDPENSDGMALMPLPEGAVDIALSQGGERFFAGTDSGIAVMAQDTSVIETLQACSSINALAASVDGILAAFCGGEGELQVFAGMGGEIGPQSLQDEALSALKSAQADLQFDESGRFLFINAAQSPDILVYSLQKGELEYRIPVGEGPKRMLILGQTLYITNAVTGFLTIQPIPEAIDE